MSVLGREPRTIGRPVSRRSLAGTEPASPATAREPTTRPAPAASPAAESVRSYLGPGCVLKGDFIGGGSLECQGTVKGKIELTEDIVIGERGTVEARVRARNVTINGRLDGSATGSKRVEVGATGHVLGDICAPAVAFAEGAFFEGNVEMRRVDDDDATGPDSARASS